MRYRTNVTYAAKLLVRDGSYAVFLIAHFLPKTTKGGKDVAGSGLVVEVRRGLA